MSTTLPLQFDVIGHVRTSVPDAEIARRRRELVALVEVLPRYADGLTGIEAYSHLIVLFWMDRAGPPERLRCHPRGDATVPEVGVFAARGRNHPNPIGLAVVELVARAENRLTVRRLDAYDGTPVIDIKPYDHYDRVTDPRVPEWFRQRALSGRSGVR
ncbi:MAG: tRNA (N6-threonylcarbamoyladenosine(37)-N6)-methyltransferase TrmO [Gammaproteobacteria bacterium]